MVAILVQRSAATPIGEGEVFVSDAADAAAILDGWEDQHLGVRHVRNALGIEAVSVIDRDGTVLATTSPPMLGGPLTNPLLNLGASEARFFAIAVPVDHDVVLDGVTTWPAGSILYQVVSPLDGDQSVLLFYDISELLGRRARVAGIQPETVQLLGLTVIFGLLAVFVFIGHFRVSRRYREMVLESELLRKHSEQLEAANANLAEARNRAERALALAEEKIRIRSEFVLMINHELRTPLTSVVTGARLLRDGDLAENEGQRLLDAVIADGIRLQEMIDQILTVARIENQGLAYPLRRVTTTELMETMRGIGVNVSESASSRSGEEPLVLTDPRALSLLIASLVDNARTHGASRVTVTVDRRSDLVPMVEVGERPETALFVTVSDDGPGIPEGFVTRVFEKFEKSSFSSGTGLGLYLARLMIEALQGSLGVQSSPEGTRFQVAIPVIATMARVDAA